MYSNNENIKRIAKNTLMLYVRMLFGMLVSLYTSRVVLQTLGVEDYGIYNVVGGFVAMFSLASGSLSASTSRFLTFELGKGEANRLKRVFSTSLSIHACMVLFVLLLTETIGLWFLNCQINIPTNRLCAANWVFQASALTFMLGLFSVPYNALLVAHERMKAFAYIGILEIFLKLLIVLVIAYLPLPFDRLIVYACLLAMVSLLIQFVYLFYCYRYFEECHLQFCFDRTCWKEMGAFTGWGFIGNAASVLSDHGINILLNLFFGSMLNAARGVSNTVNTTIVSFVRNFTAALNPQITKSYANDNLGYMMLLVERGARFSFYILLVLILPVLLETDFILTLWLKYYPLHTTNFVRLALLLSLCDVITTNTLVTLLLTTGNIKKYQLSAGGMLLMNFPLSYIFLRMNFQPEIVYVIAIFISFCCMYIRLFFLSRMVGLSIRRYLKNVCLNVLLVISISIILPAIIHFQMQSGWLRFMIVTFSCFLCTGISIFIMGCSAKERNFIFDMIKKIPIKKLGKFT